MRTYYASGTIGDTFVILCKLYSVAIREKILCKHYAGHKEVEQVVREIYSLLPNINVEFLEDEPSEIQICGNFWHRDCEEEQNKYNLEPEYYPEFELEDIKRFDLPKEYVAVQSISGRKRNRGLSTEKIDEITRDSAYPPVFVGNDKGKENIANLSNKTSVKEMISIIKGSRHFYGPQGFLSFVAVSQKIPSTVYLTSRGDRIAVERRIEAIKEWKRFLVRKERI